MRQTEQLQQQQLQMDLNAAVARLALLLKEQGHWVTAAESCTGGMIASGLTAVAGSSAWFSQSWVTYSNSAKQQQLAVPEATLQQHGAVSAEVVEAMAVGARAAAGSDLAMAVSGIAGPGGGSIEKPVGTVWIGWAWEQGLESEQFLFAGERETVRMRAALAAILGSEKRFGQM